GTLGRIRNVALTWRVETYAYRAAIKNWKTQAETGGGTLNNFASHTLYYLEWLFGAIDKINGFLAPRNTEVEARVEAWIEFSQGSTGSVSIAADAFLGPGHRLEVYGELGALLLENTTNDYARGFSLFVGNRESSELAEVEIAESGSPED